MTIPEYDMNHITSVRAFCENCVKDYTKCEKSTGRCGWCKEGKTKFSSVIGPNDFGVPSGTMFNTDDETYQKIYGTPEEQKYEWLKKKAIKAIRHDEVALKDLKRLFEKEKK